MNLVAVFFAGAFICNGIPHASSGLMGQPFPSPFSKPIGIGDSSPTVNFLWGFSNLLAGMFLLSRWPVVVGLSPGFITFAVGVLAMGLSNSAHFGKVMRNKAAK